MNFFEQELRKLAMACDGITNPVFAGRACFGDLGGENRVKLQYVTTGYADHYEALEAKILNRAEGTVDTLLFRFKDIWGSRQVSNPNFRDGVIPHIWTSGNKSEWYVYQPTSADFKQLGKAVGAFIGVFADKTLAPEKARLAEKESVTQKLRDAAKTPAPRKASAKNQGPEL